MKYIAHRGNIAGKNTEKENSPSYVKIAMSLGYDVEVDVWSLEGKLFLGHDYPKYPIQIDFLENDKIWSHVKNIEALQILLPNKKVHCFWHQNDDYTITSKNIIWAYPGKKAKGKSVMVHLDDSKPLDTKGFEWICTDNIVLFNK